MSADGGQQIIPLFVNFNAPQGLITTTGLLFYDDIGTGEFHTYDYQGGISLLRQHTDWRRSWTKIIIC
jgi:hypothetical protein